MNFEQLVATVRANASEDAFRVRLDPAQWKAFGGFLVPQELRGGERFIRQGQTERQAFLIGEGMVQVYLETPAPGSRIAILRPGAIVGEAGLFSQCERMASVEAMSPCKVWVLQLLRFEEMAQRMPAIALEVLRGAAAVMAVRMRANLHQHLPIA